MNKIVSKYLNEVQSTNQYLKDYISLDRDNIQNIAIYTDNQLNGYGKQGRAWHTEKGHNLSMSVLLKNINSDLISIFALNATLNTISELTGLQLFAKWPNDILLDNKKLCGILCENIYNGDYKYTIIGIGVNVNNSDFPSDLAHKATSLYYKTGRAWDIDKLFECILSTFEVALANFDVINALQQYRKSCLNIGKNIEIIVNKESMQGKVLAIDDKGHLLVDHGDRIKAYAGGEVSLFYEGL